MVGMEVVAYFDDSSSESATWAATGVDSGAASGTGWSLSEAGDTWDSNWTLSNSSTKGIASLRIDAGLGDTAFDTYFNDLFGTTNSARGKDFAVTGGLVQAYGELDILATYKDLVALTGNPPVGDLYRRLKIDFTNSAFASGSSNLTFVADTDNFEFAGDLQVVPEPSTLLVWSLLASLGIGCGAYRRKR